MAAQSVHSYSVKSKDTESEDLINRLKKHCDKTGTTMSHLVLKGLYLVEKEVFHGGKDS